MSFKLIFAFCTVSLSFMSFSFAQRSCSKTSGDHHAHLNVQNLKQLIVACSQAKPGTEIYIDGSARIDLTRQEGKIILKPGMILKSSWTMTKGGGALLYTTRQMYVDSMKALITTSSKVRIQGIRFRGPDTMRRVRQMDSLEAISHTKYYSIPLCKGIAVNGQEVEISNCELYGFSYGAIDILNNAKVTVDHCYIHHNQRHSLGYGIVLDKSYAIIHHNVFDFNRHAISGSGVIGSGYEAHHNLVLSHNFLDNHAFDMHGGIDRGDGTNIAGDYVSIHDNTFLTRAYAGVRIRGITRNGLKVYNNKFVGAESLGVVFKRPLLKNDPLQKINRYDKDDINKMADCPSDTRGELIGKGYQIENNTYEYKNTSPLHLPPSEY